METLTRKRIFEQASRKLRQDFEELKNVPHNGLRGGEAENLVKAFLISHLPKRYDVGSGFIIDRQESVSRQTDIIIYDALNCPVYRSSDNAGIYPSDNVAAVVEVKSRLDKKELESAFKNIAAAKSLAKTQPNRSERIVTSQTLGCLFAFESSISSDKISEHYYDFLRTTPIGIHVDLILVLDESVTYLISKPQNFPEWGFYFHEGTGGSMSEGMHLAIATRELKIDSLDAFLRHILTYLTFFRGIVDHPGFNWEQNGSLVEMKRRFFTTICMEENPEKRQELLKKYINELRLEFRLPENMTYEPIDLPKSGVT